MRSAFNRVSRALFGCLAATSLLAFQTRAVAQENTVAISITGPENIKDKGKFEQLRNDLLFSFEYGLPSPYSLASNPDTASHRISLELSGPSFDCNWQLSCTWSKGAEPPAKCWERLVHVPYCGPSDMEQINCLGGKVDLNEEIAQQLPEDWCEPSLSYNTVYIHCLEFDVDAKDWQETVSTSARNIPRHIEMELDEEFKELGYDIYPAGCIDTEASISLPNPDLVLEGTIREKKETETVYVYLLVNIENEKLPADMKDLLKGETPEIARDDFRDLADAIVTHIRTRLQTR